MIDGRRRAIAVGTTVVVVTLVALASGGGVDGRRARDLSGLGRAVATVVQAGSVLFIILMAGFMAWLYLGGGGGGRRRKKNQTWGTILALVVAIAVVSQLERFERGDGIVDTAPRPPSVSLPVVTVPPGDRTTDTGREGWVMGAVGALLVVLVAGGVAVARRRAGGPPVDVPMADVVAPTPAARDDAVARAHACTDPRPAVVLAFAAAEAVLAVDRATRRPPATSPREWAALVRSRPLDELVRRYEVARFSDHAVTAADRTAALAALDELVEVAVGGRVGRV